MHKTKSSKTDSSTFSNSLALNSSPQLAHRPFGNEIQKASVAAKTQTDIENEGFAEQMEATGLSIQAKSGTITSEGQERLTVLQAKMDGLLNSRLSHATRFGHNIANIPLRRPQTPTPIQAKLTIGEPGDKYEQEADETARQVVQKIHQPQGEGEKVQRESLPEEEEELQMKLEGSIQRESLPSEEEELQIKPMVQRVADGGMVTSPDLETSIQQARGNGQPLADSIKSPMEQPFGADFSRVKVHVDTRADQLNQSIQAKAFTTGQDVFFRQGAYEPESRGGQELIAHELTHVVQQDGGEVRRSPLPPQQLPQHPATETPSASAARDLPLQAKGDLTGNRPDSSVEQRPNKTGIPDVLKAGVESLSGYSLDDVRVHYNSPKPAQLQALAYTQGTDIHLGSGQERHLPHEAWHVVQQKQERVKSTMQMEGKANINDDAELEKEADVMGTRAFQLDNRPDSILQRRMQLKTNETFQAPIQLMKEWTKDGFQNIEKAPTDSENWLKCKYKGEETYIKFTDMEKVNTDDWKDIDTELHEDSDDEKKYQDKNEKDEFPNFNVGEVTSITIIKESRSDHQYVIAMVKGGGNIKMHYGTNGGLSERNDEIDNEHGIPISSWNVPKGLTGDKVIEIFDSTKESISEKFQGGNCGSLATELLSKFNGITIKSDNDWY
ncbi:DUF4157 domain-containing protein [Nostoc punctiforme UO1]|uniref:eCIS core domain-containing protein n=1 Tax=Nostoc punctiforme TaxID=272131 RepID=UPI0030B72C6D